jgi:hypothetical protein
MKTLLQRAKAAPVPQPKNIKLNNRQLEDLAVAFFKGEVTYGQVSRTVQRTGSTVYALMNSGLRRALAAGRATLK